MLTVNRFEHNPIISPADVQPSRPDFEVVCVFNAGVARYNGETILLMRVAERPIGDERVARVPVLHCENGQSCLQILEFDKSDSSIGFHDPRKIFTPDETFLTTISHLRVARSRDGKHFSVDSEPAIVPDRPTEVFGLEDPRISEIDGTFYITYKSVSEIGISVSLAETRDFVHFEKRGVIFAPENMDVCIFPEKIGGRYVALHRPVSMNIAKMNLWMAYSADLLHWGDHQFVMGVKPGRWDGGRIGAGIVPIKTEHGWLEIYHAATPDDTYCLGAVLLDLDDPQKVIARLEEPVMVPGVPYETDGFMKNVVFTCGATTEGDRLTLYYGAADEVMCGAEFSISELLDHLLDRKPARTAA